MGTRQRTGKNRNVASTLVGKKELLRHDHMPIHTAATVGSPANIILLLGQTNPTTFQSKARGLLPLHIAVRDKAPLETVQSLLSIYPKAAFIRTEDSSKDNRSALHLAMIHDAPVDVVNCLLAANPGAVDECDAWGHRPVHYGLIYHSSLDVVRLLLAKDGHHTDHSFRNVAERMTKNEFSQDGEEDARENTLEASTSLLFANFADKLKNKKHQHEHQYWNKPWNHQKIMMLKKRWGIVKKKKEKIMEVKPEEGEESDSSSSSSSGSSSSGSSGSSDSGSSGSDSSDSDDD